MIIKKDDDFLSKSKTYQYFEKKLLNDKKNRDLLVSLEELLNIKKNIKNIYNTDNPEEIKKLIGKKIKDIEVKQKDYEYSLIIDEKYKAIYEKCKEILEKNK